MSNEKVMASEIAAGETFFVAGIEWIKFPEKDEAGSVMDPLLYEKKCFDPTVDVDTTYGENAVISEEDEEEEFEQVQYASGE
jgi:hypothetical protein